MPDNEVKPPPIAAESSPDAASGSPAIVAWFIRGLIGLAGFLLVLIVVILSAHQLRPVLRGESQGDGSDDIPSLVATLTNATGREARQQAARAIIAKGPEATATALDALVTVSGGDNSFKVSAMAVAALAEVGPDAAPRLAAALSDPRANVRIAAAFVLREMGAGAAPAADALARAVEDAESWVRWYACEALGGLGGQAAEAVPALADALGHHDHQTRRRAAAALGRIGPTALPAVEALKRAEAEDSDRDVRREATLALYQINLEEVAAQAIARADSDVAELIKALGSAEEPQAVAAARQLAERNPRPECAVPALALALRSESKWVREAAAGTLATMPREARNAVPALRVASDDPEIEVRIAARKALDRIEGRP